MNNRTIRVRGSARVSAAPDWVEIHFDLESREYKYSDCIKKLGYKTETLRSELVAVNLEKDSLKTADFSVETDFEWINKRHVFRGYKAHHNMVVAFPFDKDYLNKVLAVLGTTASEASFRVIFKIKDPEPFRQQAIADAVKNCREKAEVLAQAAGVALGELIEIDYSWSEVRFESRMELRSMVMEDTMESPAYDIEPDDINISDSVTAIWAIA